MANNTSTMNNAVTEEVTLKDLLGTETMVNDAPITLDTWSLGDVSHQGDLIFVNIGDEMVKGAVQSRERQLAPGNTQGSRHIAATGVVYTAPAEEIIDRIRKACGAEVAQAYIGPVIMGPCTVTHPEHGHQTFPTESCIAVVYQRSLDAEEREARVRD